MGLDINKKIEGIMQSVALDDLSLKYLPPVADNPSDYYFISYSHKDYKQVYSDIYALQAEGVNIWYDRAMPAGESWERTAEKYIRPSRCAGVVFYVSENSLLSPAIHKEIEFAKQCGKSCLTINLPLDDGESYSARQMLDIMIANGAQIPADKYNFIAQTFNDDVLYLPYLQSAEHKAEKILRLEKPQLFEYTISETYGIKKAALLGVNDIDITEFKYEDCDVVDTQTGEQCRVTEIGQCAFANCRNLKSVQLKTGLHPIYQGTFFIRDNAFYACKSLTDIDVPYFTEQSIGEMAFAKCSSLQSISLSGSIIDIGEKTFSFCSNLQEVNLTCERVVIDKYAFEKCISLTSINMPTDTEIINDGVFYGCEKLEKVELTAKIIKIGFSAFGGCKSLQSVVMPDSVTELGGQAYRNCTNLTTVHLSKGLTEIGSGAFEYCRKLKIITIPNNVKTIESSAFNRCTGLVSITIGNKVQTIRQFAFGFCGGRNKVKVVYKGTVAQWNNIAKDPAWCLGSGIECVCCDDGNVNVDNRIEI